MTECNTCVLSFRGRNYGWFKKRKIVVKDERMSYISYFLFLVFGKFMVNIPQISRTSPRRCVGNGPIFNPYIIRGLLLVLSFVLLAIDKLCLSVSIVYDV